MLRLRITASFVSMLSFAMMVLAYLVGAPVATSFALLVAGLLLAVVAPFDAPAPRQRLRVVAACAMYAAAVAAALVFAYAMPDARTLILGLVLLLLTGVGLTLWAVATCNRRRIPQHMRYYMN